MEHGKTTYIYRYVFYYYLITLTYILPFCFQDFAFNRSRLIFGYS